MPSDHPHRTDATTARKQAILDVTVRLLEERGADGFTIDDVLVESDTSASSLYHHFGSREGLLAAAERRRYGSSWGDRDRGRIDAGVAVRSNQELLDFVADELRRIAADPDLAQARRSRVQVVARSYDSRDLAAHRSRVQDGVIDAIATIFRTAQERGFAPRDLDTRAYSAWYFGMTISRAFTEDGTLDADAWLQIAIPAALAPLRMADAPASDDPAGEPADG